MAKMKKRAPKRKMTQRDFLIEQCLMDAYYERTGEQIDESLRSWMAGKKAQLSQGIKNIGTGIGNAAKSIANKAIVGKRAVGTGISNIGKGISHNTKKGIRKIAAKGLDKLGAKNAAREIQDYQTGLDNNFSYDSVDTSDKFKKGKYGSIKDAKTKAELATLGKQIAKLLTQYKEKGGEIPNTEIDTLIGYLSSSNSSNANTTISKNNKMNYSADNIKSKPIKPISQQSDMSKSLTPSGETAYKEVGSDDDIQTDDTKVTSSNEDSMLPEFTELAEKIHVPDKAKDSFIKIISDLYWDGDSEELNNLPENKAKVYKDKLERGISSLNVTLYILTYLGLMSHDELKICNRHINAIDSRLHHENAFKAWLNKNL